MTLPIQPIGHLADVAAGGGVEEMLLALPRWLERWYDSTPDIQLLSLVDEPVLVTPLVDAYLGAVAEFLSETNKLPIPEWTDSPHRFLTRPHYQPGREVALLIRAAPRSFMRRMVYVVPPSSPTET